MSGSAPGCWFDRAEEAARAIGTGPGGDPPVVGVVLGSGLGPFADRFDGARSVPYAEIPHFLPPTVPGHAGRLVLGRVAGVPVAILAGRIHPYEGHEPAQTVFPVRVLARLGVRTVILTNAAGGIEPNLMPGDLMLIEDHINFLGRNPLAGPNEDRLGPRFPDMTEAYDRGLRRLADETAVGVGLRVRHGIYAAMAGPSYETPAEIRMLDRIGAHAVGMSTVWEAIAASQAGLKVVGISCITNRAAGTGNGKLSHDEVLAVGDRVREDFFRLLLALIPRIARVTSPGS